MAKAKKKAIVKSSAVKKIIDSSLDDLTTAHDNARKAVDTVSKEGKKLKNEALRLRKKRDSFLKRKKTAMLKLKKTPNAINKKALSAAIKELTATEKLLSKNLNLRESNATELKELKNSLRRASAFVQSLGKIDRELNKKQAGKKKKPKAKKAGKSKAAKVKTAAETTADIPAVQTDKPATAAPLA